ncbi:glycosyltransferase family protein [Mucilaginibacter pedocola]|uniref:Oligosaccharide biosynthesis protein Alg14 n=1 Tax=Mucilaginibacter pedocola TaxID=1792845 RepID=A0A1S9P825_9SPHI|nr:oligosaccharide biosynthesis protein Alg14 [Mucilaginibacter pedocola]OOQ57089.1 oligosaccharide biosynthesis protein Alg14 [Mucilaginibacter pedocola]
MKVLAVASIGGHWIQLLRLMPLFKEHDVTFMSTNPSLQDTVKEYKFYHVPDSNRRDKVALMKSTLSVSWLVFKIWPRVIITTGAAPGLIAIFAGKLIGAKTIWIDSIANVDRLSMSGKMALKIADRVYTQWEHLQTEQVIYSGNIL